MCDLSNAWKEKAKQLEERLTPPDAPTEKDIIPYEEISRLYSEIFPDFTDKIFISDLVYEITSISELRRFVEWDEANLSNYVSELLDCDDFALSLAGSFARYKGWSGFPVTFIWGDLLGGHAFCTAVAWPSLEDRTPTVYFLEPQSDEEISFEMVEGMKLWLLPM